MRRWGMWLVIVAALVGSVAGALALQHYLTVNRLGFATPSFCNISEQFNCDVVAVSSYATIANIPIAGIGFLFFALQFLFACWVAMQREAARGTASFGIGLALLGVIPSAYLLYVMLTVLQTICLTCLAMDFSLGLVILGWWASRAPTLAALRNRQMVSAPLLTMLVFAAIGTLFLVNLGAITAEGNQAPAALVERALQMHFQQPQQTITYETKSHPAWGSDTPLVEILEFSDFQCPFCREEAFRVRPYLAEFRNQVRVVFFNYPLDQSCNASLQRAMHTQSCLAARAAVCALQAGKFWEYHDAMFRDQAKLNRDFILKLAAEHGLNPEQFTQCLDDPATDTQVKADIALGQGLQLQGTPALFINGRQLHSGWQNKEFLRTLIKTELSHHATKAP